MDRYTIIAAMRQQGKDVERSVGDELAVLAQETVRLMQSKVATHQSTLLRSLHVQRVNRLAYEVGPGVDYGYYVENGVKPGGKGLPRFFDPAAKSIVDWLARKPSSKFMGPAPLKKRRTRRGSKLFTQVELALRDRYEGLALHIRRFGTKAQPFVEPTALEMQPIVLARIDLAVRRALAANPGAGSAA